MISRFSIKNSLYAVLVFFSGFAFAQPDVGVSITSVPPSFTPGESQSSSYVFSVAKTVAGEGDVLNLNVAATFDIIADLTGLTWTCTVPSGTSVCDNPSGTGAVAATVDLKGDVGVVFAFTNITVKSNVFTDMDFDVSIISAGDGDNSNNSDSATITRATETEISIAVSDSSLTYTPGIVGNVYSVIVTNIGPSDAQAIDFMHVVPAGMIVTEWECTADANSSCIGSGGMNATVDPDFNIKVGESAYVDVTVDYISSMRTIDLDYTVTAEVSDGVDPDLGGADTNPATVTDTNELNLVSNLSITVDTLVPADTNYTPGNGQTYVVTVSNSGDSDVIDATVIDNNLANFSSINWICSGTGGSTCSGGSGNLDTTANIIAGEEVSYTVTVVYDSSAASNPLIYQVTATNPTGTPAVNGTSPVDASNSLIYDPESNLSVTLSDSQNTYTPGTNGVFELVVSNAGPSDVMGVKVVDNAIAEFEAAGVSWTCVLDDTSSCGSSSNNDNFDTTVNIPALDNATFTITGSFDSSAITNPLVYTVTATNPMGARGNSPAEDTDDDDALDRKVNLTVTKTGKVNGLIPSGPGDLFPNEPFTYSIVVSNAGPSDLGAGFDILGDGGIVPTGQGVNLVDNFDSNLKDHLTKCNVDLQPGEPKILLPCWEFCSSDIGAINGDVSSDNCPDSSEIVFDSGTSMNLNIQVASGNSSEIRVHTRYSSGSGSDCDDDSTATNEVCNTVSIALAEPLTTEHTGNADTLEDSTSNEIVFGSDLVVTKTDDETSIAPGTSNSYTIVVRNNGFVGANGIVVTDVMPIFPGDAAGYDSGSISWFCETSDVNACCNTLSTSCGLNSPTGTIISDQLNATIDLGAQTEVTFTITGDVATQATGIISNSATATLPSGIDESNPLDNTDITDTTSLDDISDIVLVKTLEPPLIDVNDPTIAHLTYKVIVTNLGPSAATAVRVMDQLGDLKMNPTTRSWTCSESVGASCATAGPITNAPINTTVDLDVDASATFTITVSTNSGEMGKVVNIASATTSSGFDPVDSNNIDSVEYSLTGASELTINNDDFKSERTPGLPTSYTVKVTNEGPDNVFGAKVVDVFPPELTDVEWSCSAVSPIPGDISAFSVSDQNAIGTHMIISPDDNHIYITSPNDNGTDSKLYVFKRNNFIGTNFGEINLVEVVEQGVNSVDGIEAPIAMSMSSSGQHLYVLSDVVAGSEPAIAIFGRDSNNLSLNYGKLTFQGLVTENIPASANDILLTNNQKYVYVSGDDNIEVYSRNAGTGALTYESTKGQSDAGGLVQNLDGSQLYVVDATGGNVNAYNSDNLTGELTVINTINNPNIGGVTDAVASADGSQFYLASAGTNKIVILDRNENGSVTFNTSYDNTDLALAHPAETLNGLTSISVSKDGEHVFVGNPAIDAILVMNRNSQGLLSKKETIDVAGLDGVSDVIVTADGEHVLTTAAGDMGKTLTVLERRQPDPVFSFVESEVDGYNDLRDPGQTVDGLLGTSALSVSSDGKHVYAAGLGDNSISVFSRDKSKGSTSATRGMHLNYITSYYESDIENSGLVDIDSMALTANGNFLYVGSADQSTLTVFARASDGTLTFVTSLSHEMNTIDGLLGISGIVIDPSSQHLYVAGRFEASVAHYLIEVDGSLNFVGAVANGDEGVSGMAGARSLAITPDGLQLLVASSIDDSVVVLTRLPASGEISFSQRLAGVGDQPMDLAISPDGEHVYVVAQNDSRVSVLKRVSNPSSENFGRISIVTSYSDGIGGFNQLLGARTIAISNDGSKVYVGAEFDNAITMMDRNENENSATFGELALIEVQVAIQVETNNATQVEVLNQIYDLVISDDNKNVYTAGFSANAISAFVLGTGSACGIKGSGNINDTVDVGVNGTLTYTINAKIRPDATGVLVTEASILSPNNFTAINPVNGCSTAENPVVNNCDRDSSTLVPVTDLSISKTDNRLTAIPGEPVQYEIIVNNNGPSNAKSTIAESITVTDLLNSGFDANTVNWSCEAVGSGSLAFTQSLVNGVKQSNEVEVAGLEGVSSLFFSADLAGLGPHILATSVLENGLLAFSQDQSTGKLTQVLQSGDYIQADSNIDLTGARDVLVIDDDIYVASQIDDALVAFKASDSSGLNISFVANHNFSTQAFGLNQAVALVASIDKTYIYVAGANDSSIAIFKRDPNDGLLTYDSLITQGDVNGSLGISGVNALALSEDNYSLYTSGVNNGGLGVYKRDLVTGLLSLVEVIDSTTFNVPMTGVSSILVSKNGKQVYVTSALNNAVYVFNRNDGVAVTDSTYGSLSLQQEIKQGFAGVVGLLAPAKINGSSDGRHVYVASEQSDSVLWFARNLDTGILSFGGLVNDFSANTNGLNGVIDVIVDETGNYVYAAGSLDNAIAVLSRLDDSFCLADGTGDIQTNVDIAVNGSLIFQVNATVASDATVTLFNRASVSYCANPVDSEGMFIPACAGSDTETSNNIAEDEDSIESIADLMITKTDGLSQFDGLAGVVKLTGNNENIYVAAKGDNAIGIFARNDNGAEPDFGNLTFVESITNGVDGVSGLLAVSDVILSSDGKTLYAAGTGDSSIVVFSRDLTDGSLIFLEKLSSGLFSVEGIEGVKSLALSADGNHLYATGPLTNSMAVFSIDQTSGGLTFEQSLQNSVAGASGLISVTDVAVSIDGKYVYLTSGIDNSFSVFLRNPNSESISFGQLTYLATYTNGTDGVAGIAGASAIALLQSNGTDYVYILGAGEQSVALFSRVTGGSSELSFVEFKQNGTSNVEGLTLGQDLVISADGLSLYVAGFTEKALVQFDRNETDGTLEFVNALNDGDMLLQPGEFIDGLEGASGLFTPMDGSHVYVVAALDNSLATFSRDNTGLVNQNGNIAFQQALIDGEGGVSPGTEVTYTIVVSNGGPSNVKKAVIKDNFPPEFEQISFECIRFAGADCTDGVQNGNVDVVADLPVGSKVVISATGMIKSDATGTLVNTATVSSSTIPEFVISDPNLTNNTATDDDTLLSPAVNLVVTKDNGLNTVIPGTPVTYTIVVSNDAMMPGNNEPADISNVLITDIVPEEISNVTWSCEAFPQPGLLDDADGDDLVNSYVNYNDLDIHNDMVINQAATHSYVSGVSAGISTLLVYERNQRTGGLVEIQRLTNASVDSEGFSLASGLTGASGLALSPDQKHLYVASEIDDSIVAFSIDSLSAELTFVGVLTDSIAGVNGIGGAKDVILSIDGGQVYVAGKLDNAIALFNRNPSSGALSYSTLITGVEGLSGVDSMVFDSTGQYLLVVAESNDSLASFKRAPGTGILTPVNVMQEFILEPQNGSVLKQPVDVVFNSGKIYVASSTGNAISVFDMDETTGELSFDYVIRDGDTGVTDLVGPSSLVFSETGTVLYVASSVSGAITLFGLENEQISPLNIVYDTIIIPGLDNVTQLVLDELGGYFYALSDDLVLAKVLNGSSCTNQGSGNITDMANISSGGHLTYTLQGDVQPAVTGTLTNTATALVGPGFVEIFSPDNSATDADVLTPISDLSAIKTDGLLEVVAGTSLNYDISVFAAGPSTVNASIIDAVPLFPTVNAGFFSGTVDWQCVISKTVQFNAEYVDDSTNGLNGVSDVIISSDGLFAYATSSVDGSVAIFDRNISGELLFSSLVVENDMLTGGEVKGLSGAVSLNFDTTEKYLYVVGEASNSIVVFSRDPVTGLLDFVEQIKSGVDGVIGLTGPVKVVVSPDNTAIYVAVNGSDAIAVFSRDMSTGKLSFVERVKDGFGTFDLESNAIIGIADITMSFDGKYIYTAADFSDAIAVFSRDLSTQVLTFVEVIRTGDINGGIPVPGMDGLQSMVMSPGSKYVYAVATLDSSLLTFLRNETDGTLTYQSVLQVGDVDAGEILSPTDVAITPDGGRLLVADADSDSVSVYDRNISSGDIELLDVFTNNQHGSTLMTEPKVMVTDGINIMVVSQDSNALIALRITAHSECLVDNSSSDVATANLLMTPGSSGGMAVQGLVHPSARGILTNNAVISPILGASDDNLSNNSGLDTTKITIVTDVELIKTGPTEAVAGETIEYNIRLTNTGPSDALEVNVEDILDPAVINATWTCSSTGRSLCNDTTGTGIVDTIVNVGIDGEINITISATISPAFMGNLENTATAIVIEEGFNTDTDLSNNSSTISTSVTMVADLSMTKTNNQTVVVAGEFVVYDIVISNAGPSDAPDNLVTDIVPSVLVNVTWTCTTNAASSCSATGSGDINDVTYLAANSQLTYQVSGFIPSATEIGTMSNTAAVEVRQPATDSDLSNNSATDTDPIDVIADVMIDLTSNINPYDPDGPVNLPFILDVTNNGPSDARDVVATFNMAANATYQIPFRCIEQSSLELVCDIGYMVAGDNKKFVIEYRLNETTPTTVTSTANVATTTFDSDLNNNTSILDTELLTGIDIRVTKSNGSNILRLGFATSYFIRIDNIGSIDAGDINIVETMPVELLNGTWTCSASNGATCLTINESSVTSATGNLPSGGVLEFVVEALVDPALPTLVLTEISNTVEATQVTPLTGDEDYQLLNNTATDTDVLLRIIFIDDFEGSTP
jgi:uncharacterized repeat protein (TIGR01451 family)